MFRIAASSMKRRFTTLPVCLSKPAKNILPLLFACIAWTVPALSQSTETELNCANLAAIALPEAHITLATVVNPTEFRSPQPLFSAAGTHPSSSGTPAKDAPRVMQTPFRPKDTTNHIPFCRVAATLTPSADSEIKMEVWLPMEGWNGKLFAAGNWGWAGSIMYDGLLFGLENGYAATSTDTGHDNSLPMGQFALGHPDKVIDYGYRAVHEMTLDAKAIVKSFYGKDPVHSYWMGCSLGGQQALTEAQRFPYDYDGIIAGSPANPIAHLNALQIWPSILVSQDHSRFIPKSKLPALHQRLMEACDELDGVKDGVLEDPNACHFDPQGMLCKGEDKEDCLTQSQVDYLHTIHAGLTNPRTHEKVYEPSAFGTEMSAVGVDGTNPMPVSVALFKYLVFQDAAWDWKTLNFDTDIAFADKVLGNVNLASNPNLNPFFARGGKLLMYHGWNDPSSPMQSVDYLNEVTKVVGAETVNRSVRLFNVPGMGHCFGGDGCDSFDKLTALSKWVEDGKAPEQIIATKYADGKAVRSHLLCAYPHVAVYSGSGSKEDAASFVCAEKMK